MAALLPPPLLCCCQSACKSWDGCFQQTLANSQAFITYGRQGNDRLLQFYGFVEADNPADTYVVCNLVCYRGDAIVCDTAIVRSVALHMSHRLTQASVHSFSTSSSASWSPAASPGWYRADTVHAGWMQEVLGQPFAAGRRQALEELGLAAVLQQVGTNINGSGFRVYGCCIQDANATWTAPGLVQRAGASPSCCTQGQRGDKVVLLLHQHGSMSARWRSTVLERGGL